MKKLFSVLLASMLTLGFANAASAAGCQLLGMIIDSDTKKPLAGVKIEFPGFSEDVLATSAKGIFKAQFPKSGEVTVKASLDGYQSEIDYVDCDGKAKKRMALYKVEQIGLITGQITDPDGNPLSAVVSFPGAELDSLATDPDSGIYNGRMPPKIYVIMAEANGYQAVAKKIMIVHGKRTTVNFTLQSDQTEFGYVGGKITNAAGLALSGVVTFPGAEDVSAIASNVINGTYNSKMPPGIYVIQVTAPGYKPVAKRIKIVAGKTTTVDFDLGKPERGR